MEHISDFWTEALAEDLKRFFLRKLNCPDLAAELTHDTYLGLAKAVGREKPRLITAMAFRIAVNILIDYQRKTNIREKYQVEDESLETLEQIPAATCFQPEQILNARQRYQLLQTALEELPVQHRTALYLKGVEGLSYAEIAAQMGISRSTVNNLLAETMRYCWDKCEDG